MYEKWSFLISWVYIVTGALCCHMFMLLEMDNKTSLGPFFKS